MIATVKAEDEQFLRDIETDLTPARRREMIVLLTGDEELAEKAEAWQILNNSQ